MGILDRHVMALAAAALVACSGADAGRVLDFETSEDPRGAPEVRRERSAREFDLLSASDASAADASAAGASGSGGVACDPVEREPNDAPSSPGLLIGTTCAGALDDDDVDWFAADLHAGDVIAFHADDDAEAAVQAPGGPTSRLDDGAAVVAAAAGRYLIEVRSARARTQRYSLTRF